MELNLLGPFELRADGVPLVVRGRGERALLALLALSAGRVVAATTLIEALWAVDELPADPVNALQLRVSKLRRSIGAVAPAGKAPVTGWRWALRMSTWHGSSR